VNDVRRKAGGMGMPPYEEGKYLIISVMFGMGS
jgi:hypothetical protein